MVARAERGQACSVERRVVILVPRTLSSTTASCSPAATLGPYTVSRAPTAADTVAPATSISLTARSRTIRSCMSELAIDSPNDRMSWAPVSVRTSPSYLVVLGAGVVMVGDGVE
ncbi:unnamed protein product [Laminaria digitata]